MADPTDIRYTAEHEWVLVHTEQSNGGGGGGGGVATIGITAYAADKLGDVVYVDLPAEGAVIADGKVVGEIESTKSVGELFAPLDGTVTEVNQAVVDSPELVNSDPVGDGWLIRVRFQTLPTLLTADEYDKLTKE